MASKAEINRCGDRLRELLVLATSSEPAEVTQSHVDAIRTVQAFRAEFQYPTTKTAVGLRQFVARESSEILVAQRLKRLPQIINKLVRMPGSKLARMEDVGGCRAVLPGGRREIDAVLKRIRRNWVVKRERDYIVRPKPTGYRGVHVVIERDGRRVEIQLRTPAQQPRLLNNNGPTQWNGWPADWRFHSRTAVARPN